MNWGSMEVAFLQRTQILLPAMQRDGGKELVRRDVKVWMEIIDTSRSWETWDSSILDTLLSIAEPFELEGMTAIEEN